MCVHISLFTPDQHGKLQAECLRFPALTLGESKGTWMVMRGGGWEAWSLHQEERLHGDAVFWGLSWGRGGG